MRFITVFTSGSRETSWNGPVPLALRTAKFSSLFLKSCGLVALFASAPLLVHDEQVGEVVRQQRVWSLGLDVNGQVIDLGDRIDRRQQPFHVRGRLLRAFQREHHVVGVEGVAVVELHIRPKLELPHICVVGDLPRCRQRGHFLALRVAMQQRLIDVMAERVRRPFVLGVRIKRERVARASPFQRARVGRRSRKGRRCE